MGKEKLVRFILSSAHVKLTSIIAKTYSGEGLHRIATNAREGRDCPHRQKESVAVHHPF